jgi:aryl-alcohol dehydrogenase-like predicted oxidoreductase
VFVGEGYRRNLAAVGALEKYAADRGITISQLAIAWTLANPAVDVAIVGARQARHVEDSLAAADITLSTADLTDIDTIMATAVTTTAVTTAAVAAGRPDRTGGVVQRRRTR